jgi:hypothetical protein
MDCDRKVSGSPFYDLLFDQSGGEIDYLRWGEEGSIKISWKVTGYFFSSLKVTDRLN